MCVVFIFFPKLQSYLAAVIITTLVTWGPTSGQQVQLTTANLNHKVKIDLTMFIRSIFLSVPLRLNESLELMDTFRFILLLVLYHKKVAMCSYMENGWCHTWRACMSVTDENVIQQEASGGSISAAHYSKYLGWIICRGWISLCVVMCTVIHCNDRLFCLKSSLLLKFLTLHQIPTAELSIYPWTFLLT